MLNWLNDLLTKCTDGVSHRIINGFIVVIKGLTYVVLQFDDIFVVVAILGVFIMMAGNRKLGTKMTSLSILLYMVLRAVLTKCN